MGPEADPDNDKRPVIYLIDRSYTLRYPARVQATPAIIVYTVGPDGGRWARREEQETCSISTPLFNERSV